MSDQRTPYRLRLYVAGGASRSRRAVQAVSRLCAETLLGRVELDVVDVYRRPEAARSHGVTSVPALVRLSPGPIRQVVGDLSDATRLSTLLGDLPSH